MKKTQLIALLVFFAFMAKSQDIPKIGDTKGIKEKFQLIKKGLSDLKKNLTKPDPMWANERNVIFEMGNGIVLFEEDEDSENLTIRFSSAPYFSGTIEDFQNFYRKLVVISSEVFTLTHEPKEENKEGIWATTYVEKGKDFLTTKTSFNIRLQTLLNKPNISISIYRYKK